jgi:hypothetical protein
MREMALWISGTVLAFVVTAGAFLLLANLATVPSAKSLTPDPPSRRHGPVLNLQLDEDRLASLEASPGQSLDLTVKNEGGRDLKDINLTLGVSSENTALSDPRYYHREVESLPAGESVLVRFEFDLAALEQTTPTSPPAAPEPSRKILEIRATTPGGVSTVRTAILPL